jgi:hypothetical protein
MIRASKTCHWMDGSGLVRDGGVLNRRNIFVRVPGWRCRGERSRPHLIGGGAGFKVNDAVNAVFDGNEGGVYWYPSNRTDRCQWQVFDARIICRNKPNAVWYPQPAR